MLKEIKENPTINIYFLNIFPIFVLMYATFYYVIYNYGICSTYFFRSNNKYNTFIRVLSPEQ